MPVATLTDGHYRQPMFRAIIALILAATAIWSIYWFVGRQSYLGSLEALAERLRQDGWQIEYSDLGIRGYPNRFDATFERPVITSQDGGFEWRAPVFQLLVLSYDPDHVIAAWPEEQEVVVNGDARTVQALGLRASLETEGSDSRIERVIIEAESMSLDGLPLEARNLVTGIMQQDPQVSTYELSGDVRLVPPDGTELPVSGTDLRVASINLDLRASVQFDKPLSAMACREPQLRANRVIVQKFSVGWPQDMIEATADLSLDPDGLANGAIEISVERPVAVLEFISTLPNSGWAEQLRPLVEKGGVSGPMTLELSVTGGRVRLVGIPLLQLPAFQPCQER